MKVLIKILLIGGGSLLLLVVVAVVGAKMIFTDSYNKVLDEKAAAGREFGKTTDKQGCLKSSLARAKKSEHKISEIKELVADETFISSCLETSAPDENFCDGVPSMSEELINAGLEKVYEQQMCKTLGYGKHNSTCKMVFSAKQKYCWGE